MINLEKINKIAVGSMNPTKVDAAKEIFSYYIDHDVEILSLAAPSGVSDMPTTIEENKQGSINRAIWCMEHGTYDIAIGGEGGVYFDGDDAYLFSHVTCLDSTGYMHTSMGNQYKLPPIISKRIAQGEELGPIADDLLGGVDIKKKLGVIGRLTHGRIPRKESFVSVLNHALIPWLHPEFYV